MSARDRNIVLAVPLIAALIAVWLLLLSPKQDQVKELDAQVSKLDSAVQAQQASISQGLQARKRFPSAYHRLVVTGKAVPVNDETASLLVQVNRAALASGVSFESITQGGGASGSTTTSSTGTETSASGGASVGGLTALPYALTFKGTFFQIADFISNIDRLVKPKGNRIASNGRLTTIDGFTLGPDDPRPLPALLATVNVTTYLGGPAPAAAGAPGSTATPAASTTSPAPAAPTSSTTSTDSSASTSTTASAPAP
jgi:Tfp pilus assembly protein PilO